MRTIDDVNTQCYRRYVFRGIEDIGLSEKKCSQWQWVAVTAPVTLGKVVLITDLISRIWSSAWFRPSLLAGLVTTRSEM